MTGSGRIVAGIDGSEGSRRALRWALAEASLHRSVLEAVEIVPRLDVGDESERIEQANGRLAEALAEVVGENAAVAVEPAILEGDPGTMLCARASSANLLVVGSRGRGNLTGLLLGSVSEYCAHHCVSPVAIVPPRTSDGGVSRNRVVVGSTVRRVRVGHFGGPLTRPAFEAPPLRQ